MAGVLFSSTTASVAVMDTISIRVLHQDLRGNGSRYTSYYIVRIVHYKEKTAIGHEFLVLYLDNGVDQIMVRIERRPSTRKIAPSSTSEVLTDDSICQLAPDFQPDEYYLISTTTCYPRPRFTVLDMCVICDRIRSVAPNYSILRNGRHCYWFCAAFLYRVRSERYTRFDEEKDHGRRGCFLGIKLISEESIRTRFTAANVPLYQWTLESELVGHSNFVTSVCFTPDGQHVLSSSGDTTIRTWDVASSMEVRQFKGHTECVDSVAISPDGQRIVSGAQDNTIWIWNLAADAPKPAPLPGHTDWVKSVAFSPDGRKIVSCSKDASVKIWDIRTVAAVRRLLTGHDGSVRSVAWSADGRYIVSGSSDRTIRVWDVKTGNLVCRPLQGHDSYVYSVAISRDGSRVVSGSHDKTVRIWDVTHGRALGKPVYGHTGIVWSVAFSPDGSWIASGSDDGTVRIWSNEADGAEREVTKLDVGVRVYSVAWSPTGDTIAAGCDDHRIRIWRRRMI